MVKQKFDNFIKQNCECDTKIALAVSGGLDSMCMLHLALSCEFIDVENLVVVSIYHKIRGENSKKDLEFVESFCAVNSVTFIGKSANVPYMCALSGRSIELEARYARYDIFDQLKKTGVADVVFTAHHGSDNAETVLMNMFRGAGIDGLCGIKDVREDYILRPLLSVTREELCEFAKDNGIEFVTDATNDDSIYTRNFVRNEVMPLIKSRFLAAEVAINNLASDATEVAKFLNSLIDNTKITLNDDEVKIDISAFDNNVLAPRYIFKALEKIGIVSDISRVNIKSIMSLVSMQNGAGIDLPHGLRAIKGCDGVTMYFKRNNELSSDSIDDEKSKFCIYFKSAINYEALHNKGLLIKMGVVNVLVEKSSYQEFLESQKNKSDNGCEDKCRKVLFVDADKITENDVLRYRRNGDKFCSFGGGTKKLKDYLIDKKIEVRDRDKLIVLAEENEVKAIVGVEISKSLAISENSNIIKLTKC